MKIEQMKLFEIEKVVEGAKEFFSESDTFRGEFNIDTFRAFWKFAYESNQGIFFVLTDDNGNVCGGIGGLAVPDYITGILSAQELFWYVRKPYRGYGLKLLEKYEQWAKARGCKKIRMVHLVDLMPDRLKGFYEHLGYRLIENVYEMEVQ